MVCIGKCVLNWWKSLAAVPKEVHGVWKGPFDEKAPGIKVKLRKQRRLGREAGTELRPFTSRGCRKKQNDGCYISIEGQGCLHEGAAKGDDQGWEQGLTFVQTLSPSQNSEDWIVFGFILQAWLVMWYSPVTLWSRGTLSLFSCRASSELPILLQPSFLQKMGLSPGKLNSHFTL